MSRHALAWTRLVILGIGVISSWSALLVQFRDFLAAYGTLLHASTSTATNPLLTPCLYGSLAFLGAFGWALYLHLYPSEVSELWLKRLLLFGVVFAGVVVSYDCADYLHLINFGVPIVCSPGVNPLTTACFRGLIAFILAYGASVWLKRKAPAQEAPIS